MKVKISINDDTSRLITDIPDNLGFADQVAYIKEIVLSKVKWNWERI